MRSIYPLVERLAAMDYGSIICRIISVVAVVSACSGNAKELAPPPLPPDVAINEGAGHGDFLLITLRAGSTDGLSFLVDTGSPLTILDKPGGKARFNWIYGTFLSLNLVTFDFPRKTLYLKPAEMTPNPHGN